MANKIESFTAQIVLGIAHLSITSIELAISVYCAYQLYQNWNEIYMKKRRPLLVLLIYIFSCYSILFEYPHFTILKFFPSASYWDPPHEIVYILSAFPRFSGLSFLTLRIYLLHFDHEYCKILKEHKWKLLIDPSFLDTNWYFMNKSKYGDHKYVIRYILGPILCIFYVVYVIMYVICRYYLDLNKSMCHSMTILFSTICTVCNAVLSVKYWKRYPAFLDNLCIRQELKLDIIVLLVAFILAFVVAPFSIFRFYSSSANITLVMVLSLLHIMLIWILTVYPKRKYSSYVLRCNQLVNSSINHLVHDAMNKSWQKCVNSKEGYECFATFLEKEFSIENILFITEYVLVKKTMMNNDELYHLLTRSSNLEYDLDLDESLMKSSLIAKIYQQNHVLFDAVYALYQKYIGPTTATLAVNISFKVSQNLILVFASLNVDKKRKHSEMSEDDISKVMMAYDAAAREITKLMNDSYRRFKYTQEFQEVLALKHSVKKKKEQNTLSQIGIATHAQLSSL